MPKTTPVRLAREGERLLAIVALCATAAVAAGCSRTTSAPEPVRAVRTAVAGSSALGSRQEFAAEIRARTESRLAFQVPGKLVERPVQLGDTVRKGQLLARLDPQDLRLAEQAARAAVQAAQANAAQAEADLTRVQGLFDQGFVSAAEIERRTTVLTAARAQLAQARAQADVQGRQTRHGTLLADAAGIVTAVEAEPGAVVAAGTPILRLAWDGPREVAFSVPEDRVGRFRTLIGQRGALRVTLWSQPGAEFAATVREVAGAADPLTRTFAVRADVAVPPGAAAPRLGQTAVVEFAPQSSATAIKLPLNAVFQHQGRTAVWVLDGGTMTVRVQPVRIAGADGNEAVVAGGLEPGQEVVTAGVHVLTPGQRVRRHGATAAPPTSAPAASAAASR